jgi:CheY-like chemotaxis protein/serine phosphatase RsbU (regulator of sigma subunit)/anti-sigma regulatory factor (Ser/Thr protein kinase)
MQFADFDVMDHQGVNRAMIPKEKILLVDDHPLNLKLLQGTLAGDYSVLSAADGAGALEIANSQDPPDLILLDIMMPGLDGYEVCEKLKSNERTKHIPVIFLTARNEEEAESRGFVVGGVDYIVKPFHPNLVKARVRTHLDLKRHRDRLEDLVQQRTAELRKSNRVLQAEIDERRRYQEALQKATNELERRVQERTEALSSSNTLLKKEIVERRRSEEALKESQAYLGAVMAAMQTAMIIIDAEDRRVVDANPFATQLLGCGLEQLRGEAWDRYIHPEVSASGSSGASAGHGAETDCILRTPHDHQVHVRRTTADLKVRNRLYAVESLADITDMKNLLKEQEIDIELAKKILRTVNGVPPRYIPLTKDLVLFVDGVSIPCHKEGGDHFFVRPIQGDGSAENGKTLMSLKDQSGHKVGCILRSIVTDLLHHELSLHGPPLLEETVTQLNRTICRSKLFEGDDFFTSMNVEIDHGSLTLRYVSTGHPPFLLIREDTVISLPDRRGMGNNIPVPVSDKAAFSAGEYQLREGDKWIFYTDGLTEMPQKNRKRTLSVEELEAATARLIMEKGMSSVSDIALGLLGAVAEMSGEEVSPSQGNTSNDDITLVWMEIENRGRRREEVCRPKDKEQVSGSVDRLTKRISVELRREGYSSMQPRIRAVLEEAMLNAWIHGNREDPDKNITVRWRWGNDLHLEVIDEGDGFDCGSVPDPTSGENVTRTSGRGIFIMRYFADAVTWEGNGRHVVASFRRRSVGAEKTGLA